MDLYKDSLVQYIDEPKQYHASLAQYIDKSKQYHASVVQYMDKWINTKTVWFHISMLSSNIYTFCCSELLKNNIRHLWLSIVNRYNTLLDKQISDSYCYCFRNLKSTYKHKFMQTRKHLQMIQKM